MRGNLLNLREKLTYLTVVAKPPIEDRNRARADSKPNTCDEEMTPGISKFIDMMGSRRAVDKLEYRSL